MILDLEQIKSITCGAEKVFPNNGGFDFRRFTDEQTELYIKYRDEMYGKKSLVNSGIRLAFTTDSGVLSFTYGHYTDHSLGFGWIEVFVNGKRTAIFPVEHSARGQKASVSLGEGVKNVEIYLPWQKNTTLADITLDDGALVKPLKRSFVLMAYGDSITKGHNAQVTTRTYITQLAVKLDADLYNKAIGGDRFFPELLTAEEPVTPDIITVAYGTNDWIVHTRETLTKRSRDFMVALSEKFPTAKIFAISPIWRAMQDKIGKFGGHHSEVHGVIENAAAGLANVTVIDGGKLAPSDPAYYTDGLHPHDFGMDIYAENLYKEIKKYI